MKHFPDSYTVHLLAAQLDLCEKEIESLSVLLSARESARARRFIFPVHRRRFIAARGVLRRVLGRYLDMAPEDVVFSIDPRGKPYIENAGPSGSLHFNLSHSAGMALIGLAVDRKIGVDLEYIDEGRNPEKLASRFFPANEAHAVASAPEGEGAALFFRYWTAKEAYLKAVGDGIRRLEDIRKNIDPGSGCCAIERRGVQNDVWTVCSVSVCEDYAAAVAVEGRITKDQIKIFPELTIL